MKLSYSRQIILFIFLSFAWSLQSFGQQTTVNFDSYTENQGLSNPHVEGELRFEAIKGSSATCTVCVGIDINEGKDGSPGLDDSNQEPGGIIGWKISRANDASFQFLSIWLQDRDISNTLGTSDTGTIKAFKDGTQVGSTKAINFDSGTSGLKSFATDPDFFDVDYILIEGVDLFLILDEVTYNVPFIDENDTPPTVLAVNLVGAPLSTAESVTYNVEFSKIAENVTADDFELTNTGSATGTIASVSGTNASYSVLVTGLSGEGTIRLDIKAGTDISNENNVTGTAAFTSGQIHHVSPCLIEDFEDEVDGSKAFSLGGNNFSITGNLEVHTETPPIGINGSRYVLLNTGSGPYVINSLSSDIILKKFAVYLSSDAAGTNPTNDGSITVVGKNDGSQVYSITKSSGFPEDFSATSGYYIFDLRTEGGAGNSTVFIDQVEISLGGAFQYINVDNFEFCLDVPPVGLSLSAIKVDETCPGRNGSIDLTISDAIGTPIISWTGPDTFTASVEDLNNLVAGLYTVEVTDDTGTTETLEVEILLAPDTDAPIITDIDPISVGNDPGMCSASVEFSATVSDNCDTELIPIFTLTDGTVINSGYDFSVGQTTVNVNAADAAGNQAETKTFPVSVIDSEAPTAVSLGEVVDVEVNVAAIPNASNSPLGLSSNGIFAQTFEAASTGPMSRIDVEVFSTTEPGTITLNLYNGTDPNNPGTLLGTASFANVDATDAFVSFIFDSPIAVTAGSSYLMILTTTGQHRIQTAVVLGGDPYSGGTFYLYSINTNSILSSPINDLIFKSYILKAGATNRLLALDATGNLLLNPVDFDGGSSDNCGIADRSISPTSFSCNDLGSPKLVTLTVSDAVGNQSSASINVAVIDPLGVCNQPPVAVAKPLTVSADANCEGSATAVDFDGGSTDADGDQLSFSVSPVGPYPLGVTNVTLSVSDGFVTSQATTTITVKDTTPPVVTCQNIEVALGADGTFSINSANFVFDNILTSYTDNCTTGPSTFGITKSNFDCNDLGADVPVTIFVRDGNGNETACSFTVKVTDPNGFCNRPPTAVAQNFFVAADANCQGNATAADFDNGSFDPDGDEISFSVSPAGPYPLGRTPVTLKVTDSKGAFAVTTVEVVVEDKTAPVITVPADITVSNDAGACGAVVNFNATVVDNCPGATTLSFSQAPSTFFSVGTTTVMVDAVDAAGNAAAQQSFRVTVLDAEAPVTPVLADATGECGVTVDAPSTTDNCVGTITGTTTDPTEYTAQGTYQISWNFDDGNGNSTSTIQKVIVKDVTAPLVTLITPTPTAVLGLTNTVTLQASDIFAATDNCSGDLVFSPTSFTFDCDNLGDNTVSVSVTDAAGNTANAIATVTISDNEAVSIDASESGTPVPIGSNAVLKATVSPAVGGVEVTFSLDNGVYEETALTDASGLATITVPAATLSSLPIVYKVSATIEECTGLVESVAYLPIYDPNGNFVTGGGCLQSVHSRLMKA